MSSPIYIGPVTECTPGQRAEMSDPVAAEGGTSVAESWGFHSFCLLISEDPAALEAFHALVFPARHVDGMYCNSTALAVTGMDRLNHQNLGVTDYRRMTHATQMWLKRLESDVCVPVKYIGTGPYTSNMIIR